MLESFKIKIASLTEARREAIADALDNPKSLALAETIKAEIAKLKDEAEIAEIQDQVRVQRAEAERQAEEARKAEAIRKEVAKISAEAIDSARKADAALAELMKQIIAFQEAGSRVLKLAPDKRSALTLRDRTRLTRAVFGKRLPSGGLIADSFDISRPSNISRDSNIEDFVRAHLQ